MRTSFVTVPQPDTRIGPLSQDSIPMLTDDNEETPHSYIALESQTKARTLDTIELTAAKIDDCFNL